MIDRDDVRKKVTEGLAKLCEKGTRPEHIAVNLAMSYNSVKNWISGRRIPKTPTIRQIEHLYGVKIL